uniref:Ribosomal N-lysine methyltransferase set11 n=1 Tax=Lygus hesperus TaxID=30085 RepID=A0A0A9XPI3_LYGHE
MFCECLAQVLSRNFHRDECTRREGPYLLPGLDILNHATEANVKLEVRGGGRRHEVSFTAITTRPIARGEQLFLCYGDIGAARFVTEFQFITQDVLAHDMVRFSVPCLIDMASQQLAFTT